MAKNSEQKVDYTLPKGDLLKEDLATENTRLKKQLEEISRQVATLMQQNKPLPSAPSLPEVNTNGPLPEVNINEHLRTITVERHRFIKELLLEIREYDGTSDVDAFIQQIRNVRDQLDNQIEKVALVRKIIATKLKGEAQRVAERNRVTTLTEFAEAMRTAFGQLELDYEQLAEERNAMRQGSNEGISNYIKRYEEIDKRIQISIDQLPQEIREITRYMEANKHIEKFIRGLKPEIKLSVKTANPGTLRQAFQLAQKESKIYYEDEQLRYRQRIREQNKKTNSNNDKIVQSNNNYKPHEKKAVPNSGSTTSNKIRCNFCKIEGHTEAFCRKKSYYQNFQRPLSQPKDPPKKYVELEEENQVEMQKMDDTGNSSLNFEEPEISQDSWWTLEPL